MTANGLLAEAASAPLTRTIRNRAMDTIMQREGEAPVWTVKTKNLDLIRALNEACGQGRGVELSRAHEIGVVRAAEFEVDDNLLASIMGAANDATQPEPPAAA